MALDYFIISMNYLEKAVVATARSGGHLHVFIPLSDHRFTDADYRTICRYRGSNKYGIWSLLFGSIEEARRYQAKLCKQCERKLKELGQ
jgi:hypothetical protein